MHGGSVRCIWPSRPSRLPVNLLDDFERLKLAVYRLRRKARVSIAHLETGVSRPKLRHLHRELHPRRCGRSEPRPLLPAGLAAPAADTDIAALLPPPGDDR